MSTIDRKPRGPRTPIERANDAARKAATILEDVPPSRLKDEYLEPIGTLLRFYFGSASEGRVANAEQAYVGLVGRLRDGWRKWGSNAELFARPGVTNEDLLAELAELVGVIEARADNYIEADSSEAADEGFLLISKARRLCRDLSMREWKLERLATRRY